MTAAVATIREYEEFTAEQFRLDEREWSGLEDFARKNQNDRRGDYRPVLAFGPTRRTLKATNFVGVLSTRLGKPIEILPKIDLAPPRRSMEAGDDGSHSVDRTMQHYRPVMAWVGLFLFGQGLVTWRGKHENQSLLFPMEEIYEDFVTQCFRRHQDEYGVRAQGPQVKLTRDPEASTMKPDITLHAGGAIRFILDTKWKRLASAANDPKKRGIAQGDMYQLYAYGKRYGCRTIALVYPRTGDFEEPLRFVFDDDLTLLCLPFDVSRAESSVRRCLAVLHSPERPGEPGSSVLVAKAS